MKDYPFIPASTGQNFREIQDCQIFDKLDGSSMRSEWSKKAGWSKHGRRHGLLDDSNEHLVVVPDLFMQTLAEPLERIAVGSRWQHLVVFYEFWGDRSIAGLHFKDDPKRLTLFDASPNKKGFLTPTDFRKSFEDLVPTAAYLGTVNWTRGFVQRVHDGDVPGMTFEGVVGKAGKSTHSIVRAKAKTKAWLSRVIEVHGETVGSKLVTG